MSLSKSNIPYLTHVWNPVVGCRVGCPYCWCGPLLKRIGANIGCDLCVGNVPHVHPERLAIPGGKPKVIGLGFMTDLFGNADWQWPDPDEVRLPPVTGRSIFHGQIAARPEHVFVTPTKFPEGIPEDFAPPDNWWLLVTAITADEAHARLSAAWERWPEMRIVLNLEPLCGPVALSDVGAIGVAHGVIVGGMSRQPGAPEPRPMHPDWVRSLRDQCAGVGVPFALKQWGNWVPDDPNVGPAWVEDVPEEAVVQVLPGYHAVYARRVEDWPVLDGREHRELPWVSCTEATESEEVKADGQ